MKTDTAYVAHFENDDIILVDPCYFYSSQEAWEKCCDDLSNNMNLAKFGFEPAICMNAGDVYPDILVDSKDGSQIGGISSDSYILGCFRLEDVLKHNPGYAKDMEEYPNSYILIKDFTGDVVFEMKEKRYYDQYMPMVHITGKGSVNFRSEFSV